MTEAEGACADIWGQVLTVRDIMKYGVHDHMGARVELEELATKALVYQVAEGYSLEDLNEEVCSLHKPSKVVL